MGTKYRVLSPCSKMIVHCSAVYTGADGEGMSFAKVCKNPCPIHHKAEKAETLSQSELLIQKRGPFSPANSRGPSRVACMGCMLAGGLSVRSLFEPRVQRRHRPSSKATPPFISLLKSEEERTHVLVHPMVSAGCHLSGQSPEWRYLADQHAQGFVQIPSSPCLASLGSAPNTRPSYASHAEAHMSRMIGRRLIMVDVLFQAELTEDIRTVPSRWRIGNTPSPRGRALEFGNN